MGCASTRSESEPIETILVQSEGKLGYLQHDAKMIDMEIGKFKSAGLIPAGQAKKFATKMRLPFANAAHVPNTELFYGHFQQGEDYLYTSMNVLAIMLSTGSAIEKIKLLFESHDPEHKREMSMESFLDLVNIMVAIAVQYLPDFLDYNALSLIEKDDVSRYLAKLKGKQSAAATAIANRLCSCEGHPPERVRVKDLQENVRDPAIGALTSPTGIRRFIRTLDDA